MIVYHNFHYKYLESELGIQFVGMSLHTQKSSRTGGKSLRIPTGDGI